MKRLFASQGDMGERGGERKDNDQTSCCPQEKSSSHSSLNAINLGLFVKIEMMSA
jgi:hypothetical protein